MCNLYLNYTFSSYSFYDTFKGCVKEFQVDTCLAIDKSLFDVLYSYLCGEGRRGKIYYVRMFTQLQFAQGMYSR